MQETLMNHLFFFITLFLDNIKYRTGTIFLLIYADYKQKIVYSKASQFQNHAYMACYNDAQMHISLLSIQLVKPISKRTCSSLGDVFQVALFIALLGCME